MQTRNTRAADDGDVRDELRAVLHAGRELPAELDNTVIDAFMDRLDSHIDTRIAQHDRIAPPASSRRGVESPHGGVPAIIGVGIPFVVLAGVFGHDAGAILAILVTGALATLRIVFDSRR